MSLTTEEKLKYVHYEAKPHTPASLGLFLQTIHEQPEHAKVVKSVKFSLPGDDIQNSGFADLLTVHVPNNCDAPLPNQTPLQDIAIRLRSIQRQYNPSPPRPLNAADLANVPLKFIIELYVEAFTLVCPNLDAMEFPTAWEGCLNRVLTKWGARLEWSGVRRGGGFVKYGRAIVPGTCESGEAVVEAPLGGGVGA